MQRQKKKKTFLNRLQSKGSKVQTFKMPGVVMKSLNQYKRQRSAPVSEMSWLGHAQCSTAQHTTERRNRVFPSPVLPNQVLPSRVLPSTAHVNFPLATPLWQGLDHVTRNTTGGFAIFRWPRADSVKPRRPAAGPQ